MTDKTHTTRHIEIFRPGSFRSMEGTEISFNEKILSDIARSYDPALSDAPVVVGHPEIDAPAYGWVKSLSYNADEQRLIAELGDMDASFSEAVQTKRYKKISPSFFQPDAPANPKPGHYYLRHVGFLGAAAPAVSGLKPVCFAGAVVGAVTLEFSEMSKEQNLFARFKAFLAEKVGAEQADALITEEEAAMLLGDDATDKGDQQPEDKASTSDKTDEDAAKEDVKQGSEEDPADEDEEKKKKEKASFSEDLSQREKELLKREAEIAKREREAIHASNASFADGLVKNGRLLPASKDNLIAALDQIDQAGSVVSFADGKKENAASILRDIFMKQPEIVSFGEVVPKGNGDLSELNDSNYAKFGEKAREYQESQRQKGISISTIDAVNHVSKGENK